MASIRHMSRQVWSGSAGEYQADEQELSRGSAGEYQAEERAGVARLSLRVSGRRAGRCREAQLASIRQMSGQVSGGSPIEYQADEQAGVAWLSWRVSALLFNMLSRLVITFLPRSKCLLISWLQSLK